MRLKGHNFKNCTLDHDVYIRFRQQKNGKATSLVIGRVDDPIDKLLESYVKAMRKAKGVPDDNTLDWLAAKFFKSNDFKGLSKHTRGGHERGAGILDHLITDKHDVKHRLGSINVAFVKKPLINGIKEKRLNERIAKGEKGTGTINLELAFLSKLFSWGCNHVAELEIDRNPLEGLERLKVEGRKRYVTDKEYWIQYDLATPIMQCYFEVAYITVCRSVEIRNLKEDDVEEFKLMMRRRKGSKHNFVGMSERLDSAIKRAMKIRPKKQIVDLHEDKWIFLTRNGDKLKPGTITGAMTRLRKKMEKKGLGHVYWSMHLLKHKGMTDAQDKDVAGLSEGNKKIYDHEVPTNQPVR